MTRAHGHGARGESRGGNTATPPADEGKRRTPAERFLFGGMGWQGWAPPFPGPEEIDQLERLDIETAHAARMGLLRADTDLIILYRLSGLVVEEAEGLIFADATRDFPRDLLFLAHEADFETLAQAAGPMLKAQGKTAKTGTAREMGARLRYLAECVRRSAGAPLEERARMAKFAAMEARQIADTTAKALLRCRTFAGWIEGAEIAKRRAEGQHAEDIAKAIAATRPSRKEQDAQRRAKSNLIAERILKGATLAEIAGETGYSKGHISKLIRGPRLKPLLDKARATGHLLRRIKRGRPIGGRKRMNGGKMGEDEMDKKQAQNWRDGHGGDGEE